MIQVSHIMTMNEPDTHEKKVNGTLSFIQSRHGCEIVSIEHAIGQNPPSGATTFSTLIVYREQTTGDYL